MMKFAAFLVPACLVAQSPDQSVRDRLKALGQVPPPIIELESKAQFDVREFFTKSRTQSKSNETILLKMDGTTPTAFRKGANQPVTWTHPVAVNPGDEDPSEPAKLESWLHPHRLDALLIPAQALLGIIEKAKLKATKEAVVGGEIGNQHTYQFKTRVPKKYEPYAFDRDSTLVITTTKDGLPLVAEIATGYRGRVGRSGEPFGRRTHVRWTFHLEGSALVTLTYDLREEHRKAWTTTATLIGIKSTPKSKDLSPS